jgi:hypothetical protein
MILKTGSRPFAEKASAASDKAMREPIWSISLKGNTLFTGEAETINNHRPRSDT